MKNIHIPTIEELLRPEPIRRLENGNYVFTKIIYQKKVLQEVEFCPEYLEDKALMTQDDWAKFFSQKKGWCVADAEILYQCLLRAYELRNEAIVKEFRMDMQEIFDPSEDTLPITTLTRVSFDSGIEVVVSSLGPIKKRTQATLPEFIKDNQDYCYLVLAPKQPEKDLGNTSPMPVQAKSIMKALLGYGYNHAGAVFQYFSKHRGDDLVEAKLWTPTKTNRNKKMPVSFGITDEKFFLTVQESFEVPDIEHALGVRIK